MTYMFGFEVLFLTKKNDPRAVLIINPNLFHSIFVSLCDTKKLISCFLKINFLYLCAIESEITEISGIQLVDNVLDSCGLASASAGKCPQIIYTTESVTEKVSLATLK